MLEASREASGSVAAPLPNKGGSGDLGHDCSKELTSFIRVKPSLLNPPAPRTKLSRDIFMPCLHCIVGFHQECEEPTESEITLTNIPMKIWSCCCPSESDLVPTVRGPIKEDNEVTDIESTGRKRAAVAYPIADGAICEWASLKNAGGGVTPIIGCNGNRASDRHHGPDKSTLNNSSGNVHRICATCHNRWHTCNDEYYGDRPKDGSAYLPTQRPYKEHDTGSRATLKEILDNEVSWQLRKHKAKQEANNNQDEQEGQDA